MSAARPTWVLWLTGAPASGKTTLAGRLIDALRSRGQAILWLDSDDLRTVLTPAPRYTPEERDWFYGVIGHLARLGEAGGSTVVISATASRRRYRDDVRRAVPRFAEIYLSCSQAIREARDPKQLYRRAARGEISNLPTAGAEYEPPERAELVLDSGLAGAEALAAEVLSWLDARSA